MPHKLITTCTVLRVLTYICVGCKVLGDLCERLLGGEVLCDTLDELGHEEEAVAVAVVEVGQVLLEEVPGQVNPQPVLTHRLHHHHSLLVRPTPVLEIT